MEVHHHSHTARKKWTHYFWEFLMLFLAVSLGFLVENQREHYIEKKRAKQFAKAMIKDLERDTARFYFIKKHLPAIYNAMDSLRSILRNVNIKKVDGNLLYYYGRQLTNYTPFVQSDQTINQLVSSGSLRYFTNPDILKYISDYELSLAFVTFDQYKEVRDQYIEELQGRLFDPDKIDSIELNAADWTFANESLLNIKAGLLSYDPGLIQQLNQVARLKSRDLKRIPGRIDAALAIAIKLIALLKKEFGLG